MSRYQVVVSVDGSEDGTREMLAAFDAPYSLTWHWQPNRGRATACNRGVDRGCGELIVLLDDDMEPTPAFLEAHAAAHPAGGRRAVMGSAPILPDSAGTAVTEYISRKFNRHLERLAAPDHTLALRDFYSGNMSIPRSVLLETGGFDEAFTMYGNEDLELSWRLRTAGVELAFSTAAIAYQHYTKDFSALARDNVAKGRTAVLLATKHPPTLEHLKLGSPRRGPLLRRLVIGALLSLTRMWPGTSGVVMRVMEVLSRLRPPGLHRMYNVALDYFYFTGARAAHAEASRRDGAWAGSG